MILLGTFAPVLGLATLLLTHVAIRHLRPPAEAMLSQSLRVELRCVRPA